MKKNIFSVFQTNDSDDESQTAKKPEPVKLTKKESRVEDQVKREVYGDKVPKEVPVNQKFHDGPRNKGDYKSGEKRPYERHSGTGRPAFTNDFKKGGHGKGNVGDQKDVEGELTDKKGELTDKKGEENGVVKAAPVPEPVEEIITLDEWVSKGGFNADFLKTPEVAKSQGVVKVSDSSVKVVAPRQKEVETYSKKNVKHAEELVHAKGTNVTLEGQASTGQRPRRENNRETGKPKGGRVEFNEANFPALS